MVEFGDCPAGATTLSLCQEMILAEITDKMLPSSLYIGAAFFFGVSAAPVLVFLNGNSRFIGFGIVTIVAAFLSLALQVDAT